MGGAGGSDQIEHHRGSVEEVVAQCRAEYVLSKEEDGATRGDEEDWVFWSI
jgi:hypothetical protein